MCLVLTLGANLSTAAFFTVVILCVSGFLRLAFLVGSQGLGAGISEWVAEISAQVYGLGFKVKHVQEKWSESAVIVSPPELDEAAVKSKQ
jgi:hypothetical protein